MFENNKKTFIEIGVSFIRFLLNITNYLIGKISLLTDMTDYLKLSRLRIELRLANQPIFKTKYVTNLYSLPETQCKASKQKKSCN